MHKIVVSGIQLAFKYRPILNNIYLNCHTGKIAGILGRNGEGKSCLLRAIYGTQKCEKSILIDGKAEYTPHQNVEMMRYLPQFNFIPQHLSLKQVLLDFNLDFALFTTAFPEMKNKLNSILKKLSGGEKRLIEVYVILKSATWFILLDEPFTHLSPINIEKMKMMILAEKNNKCIILTDHLYRDVTDISDDLYMLNTTSLKKVEKENGGTTIRKLLGFY